MAIKNSIFLESIRKEWFRHDINKCKDDAKVITLDAFSLLQLQF